MKEFIDKIKNDSFLSLTIRVFFVLTFLHLYQYHDSGYQTEPLIRFVFALIYPLIAIFTGRKGSYIFFFLFGNYLAITTVFTNYTSFVMLVILTMLVPKYKIPILALYSLDIVYRATINNKTPIHIAIHILNCILIFYALNYLLKPTLKPKKLALTVDEKYILEEMLKGCQQKEIIRFSANTVTNKLKQARERNEIATTDELLQLFEKQRD